MYSDRNVKERIKSINISLSRAEKCRHVTPITMEIFKEKPSRLDILLYPIDYSARKLFDFS